MSTRSSGQVQGVVLSTALLLAASPAVSAQPPAPPDHCDPSIVVEDPRNEFSYRLIEPARDRCEGLYARNDAGGCEIALVSLTSRGLTAWQRKRTCSIRTSVSSASSSATTLEDLVVQLPAAAESGVVQTSRITSCGNVIGQMAGRGNQLQIGRPGGRVRDVCPLAFAGFVDKQGGQRASPCGGSAKPGDGRPDPAVVPSGFAGQCWAGRWSPAGRSVAGAGFLKLELRVTGR